MQVPSIRYDAPYLNERLKFEIVRKGWSFGYRERGKQLWEERNDGREMVL